MSTKLILAAVVTLGSLPALAQTVEVRLTEGNDRYVATGVKPYKVWGLGGNDKIFAGKGTMASHGGPGNDQLAGGPLNDWLSGGSGDDYLRGKAGRNEYHGGDGNDTIEASADNYALVYADAGDDGIYPGANGVLDAGPGNDRIVPNTDYGTTNLVVTLGLGSDYVNLFAGDASRQYWHKVTITDFDQAGGDTLRFHTLLFDPVCCTARTITTFGVFNTLDSTQDGVLDNADSGSDPIEGWRFAIDPEGMTIIWGPGPQEIRLNGVVALSITSLVE